MGTIKHAGSEYFDYFNSGLPARFIARRYAQCRADRVSTRALAHLLAPQIQPHIQSKQKPTFPPATKRRINSGRLNEFKLEFSKATTSHHRSQWGQKEF
jgi:hypothetical protein